MNPKARFYENNQARIHDLLWMMGFLSSLLFIDSSYAATLEALQVPIRSSNTLCLKAILWYMRKGMLTLKHF